MYLFTSLSLFLPLEYKQHENWIFELFIALTLVPRTEPGLRHMFNKYFMKDWIALKEIV